MKKFAKLGAVLAALILAAVCFVGCKIIGGGEVVSVWGNDKKTLTFYDNDTWVMDYKNGNVLSGTYKENSETSYELEIKKRRQIKDNSFGFILENTDSFSARISGDSMQLKYGTLTFEFLYKQ